MISNKRAIDLMHLAGTRLVLMHEKNGKRAYYVVPTAPQSGPGGKVADETAQEIIARPDVHAFDDGLFPNCPQSWHLGGAGRDKLVVE